MKSISLNESEAYYISYYEEIEVKCSTCSKKATIRYNPDEVEIKFCSNCGDTNMEISFQEEVVAPWLY